MLFGHHTIDKTIDEHLREVAALASDPQTLVFLDTNILAYLFKLHEAARQEFFVWSGTISTSNRLVIPAWAASEYLSRVTSQALNSYTPKTKEPSQVKKTLDALFETASLFVDESLLHRIAFTGNRAAFLAGFKLAIDELNKYTTVFSQQFDPGEIHQQIVEQLSAAILDSDIAALCRRASQEGITRFEHRIPPGFRDGNKEENRFGDLIIWFEILDKAAADAGAFPKVLFITNDEKSDWVYAPTKRIELVRGTRKSVPNTNPEIKLVDPRLAAEFQRKTGHPNLVISSLATLVEGLSRADATRFTQIAAAIQINTQEAVAVPPGAALAGIDQPETTESELHAEPSSPTDGPVQPNELPVEYPHEAISVEVAESVQPRHVYDLDALQDSQYQVDAPSDINAIIRALKSHNWYTQNPAITSIRAIRQESFSPSSWFVLGRNIYQAACGNSQKAMEFMATLETQLAQFPAETAEHVLAGMLFEIYFDAQGEFREKAKFSYAEKPLALVADPIFEGPRCFIQFHLRHHLQRLKFIPGDRNQMTLHIVSMPFLQPDESGSRTPTQELLSVSLNGVELIRTGPDQTDSPWLRLLASVTMRQETLRAMVSEELAIPKWALTNHFEPPVPINVQFILPEGRELHPKLALEAADNATLAASS